MKIQNGACALNGIGLPEETISLVFTARQLSQIHAAGIAYRRLFELRATDPAWPLAYEKWRCLAEEVTTTAVHLLEVESRRGTAHGQDSR